MERTATKRVFWIVGITFSMVLADYLFGREFNVSKVVQYTVIAILIEFSNYCMYAYKKDHREI